MPGATRNVGTFGTRVFVADDDDAMRVLLASCFRKHGLLVDEARNGTELVEMLEEAQRSGNPPRLVVSDLHMPGATGFVALRWIRNSPSPVPVIVITAFGNERTHRKALELGAREVFDKPFDLQALTERALALLRESG